MRPIYGILVLSTFLASPLLSQLPAATCGENETLDACYARFLAPEAQEAAVEEVERQTKEDAAAVGQPLTELAAENRVTTASTPGVPTSVLDLLPSFLAAGGLQGFGETEDSYTFDKVFELGEWLRLDLGAVIFRDPEIFEALRSKLPSDLQEQVLADLSEQVEDFDKTDLKILLSWEKQTGSFRFGRDPDDYVDITWPWYGEHYLSLLNQEILSLEEWELLGDGAVAEEKLGETSRSRTPAELRAIPSFTDEEVNRLVAGLVRAAIGMGELRDATAADMAEMAEQVSELITNQPQLVLEGKYLERDHLTGPSEWSARIRYEWSLSGNVNDFLTWAEKTARTAAGPCAAADAPSYSYGCYKAWRDGNAAIGMKEKTAIDRGNRLTIEAQYADTDPLRFDLPSEDSADPAFSFALGRTQKWTGSLTYGINFESFQLPNLLGALGGAAVVPVDTARFDLEAKYDDVTGDPMRQSRFTATATLSQKLSNKSVLSLAAVWADKPEYLGEVDEELSANLGLKWRLGDPDQSGSGTSSASSGN